MYNVAYSNVALCTIIDFKNNDSRLSIFPITFVMIFRGWSYDLCMFEKWWLLSTSHYAAYQSPSTVDNFLSSVFCISMSTTYLHLNNGIDHNIFLHIEFRRIIYQFLQSFHVIDKFDNEMHDYSNHV